jgi:hypothetical protein
MTRQDIAIALKVDASTISRDIEYLTLKSQQYIDDMAKTLPFVYQKSIEGINEVVEPEAGVNYGLRHNWSLIKIVRISHK